MNISVHTACKQTHQRFYLHSTDVKGFCKIHDTYFKWAPYRTTIRWKRDSWLVVRLPLNSVAGDTVSENFLLYLTTYQ